jgi:hypothetical protein
MSFRGFASERTAGGSASPNPSQTVGLMAGWRLHPMSLKLVQAQVETFLKTETPEVIAIRGAWGVGKTFAWKKYLTEARNNGIIALNNYSYVSLFGLNSLNELKLAVFMGMVNKKNIGAPQDSGVMKSARKKMAWLSRNTIQVLKGLPYVKDLTATIESVAFYSVRKTIICIDDFERKGKSLDAQDIMGLVNFLKEERECKVVLILNDESLDDQASMDYGKYREKVIDIEVVFSPTASECAEIGLSNDAVSPKLRSFVENLGINNIRIIKKIERLSGIIYPHVAEFQEGVLNRALHSLVLFTWSLYSGTKSVPALDSIKNLQGGYEWLGLFGEESQETAEEKEQKAVLRQYGFEGCDEFDLQVATVVEQGYVDEALFVEQAKQLSEKMKASKSMGSFNEAWDMYHNSFDGDDEELVHALHTGLLEAIAHITPLDLDSAVGLLRELDRGEMADEIISTYVEKRYTDRKIFSPFEYRFRHRIRDKKILEAFNRAYESYRELEKRTVGDILEKMAIEQAWEPDDEEVLANANPEEYYKFFKSVNSPNLAAYVDRCLRFGLIVNGSSQEKKIAESATAALEKIGKESTLNALRVRSFGIRLKTDDEPHEDC